jgi:hypothetical protein
VELAERGWGERGLEGRERWFVLSVALALSACSPGEPEPISEVWTAREFLAMQGSGLDLGGWLPDELLTVEGAPLRFQPGTQSGGPGLTLFPAVADGAVAAFVITDIWRNHPEPWVQPVWAPFDENGDRPDGVRNVFPVNVDSTFYSPFWRAELLLTPGLTPETFRSARDVYGVEADRRTGGIILCPIVPASTKFADDGSGPREPLTLRPLPKLPEKTAIAWVDGQEVSYFDFGFDRVQAEAQNLTETNAYFFVSSAEGKPLPLAAVLRGNPEQHSLVNRVDVVLPEGSAPFVPANRSDLRALVVAAGLSVPTPPPALDAFPELALRVATNPECFESASFPTACTWLDTTARVEALATSQRISRPVQLAIGVVSP